MRNTIAVAKINGAINALRAMQGDIERLPATKRRMIVGANNIGHVIHGLEMAKAELSDEPMPQPYTTGIDASDLEGIIDN